MFEHKFAQTSVPIHDLMRERWSSRSFSERPISAVDLKAVLEAGRWAASSSNEQPWRFIVGRRGTPAFDCILGLLMPGNQAWAKNASVLMIIAARTTTASGRPNRYHLHDAGAATAQMLLQASASGFGGHAIGGFDHERATKDLNFPPEYVAAAALALGYIAPSDEVSLEERYAQLEQAPRQCLPLTDLVFEGDWNAKANLDS